MPTQAQRFIRVLSRALAVILAGVLLTQHLPLAPPAGGSAGSTNHGCTEQVCRCGADCTCAHCAHHAPEHTKGTNASEDTGSGEGPTLRSCGGTSQGPLGAFVVAKSLVAPAPPMALAPRSAAADPRLSVSLVPQRRADDIFHPPKGHVG